MKYIREFENHAAYEAAESGLILPNVSLCVNENEVHYNPWVETRLVAKFNVTDTSNQTKIVYSTSYFSEIEIDGSKQPSVTTGYTFDTIGEHTVKYTLKNPTSIGTSAFYQCSSLTSIEIPSGVTSIDNWVFGYCSSLTSIVIPSGVTSIGASAFYGCSSLTSINIPDGVTSISDSAFSNCSSLTSIVIPSGVTSIGISAFYQCNSLTSINIPNSVTSIGNDAFKGCYRTTIITVRASTPPTLLNSNAFDSTGLCPICVPSDSVDTYKSASGWSTYASRIQAIP